MPARDESTGLRVLLVAHANLLDGTVESAADRELLRGLATQGIACEAVGRFVVPGDAETDPKVWLDAHEWTATAADATALRSATAGVPVALYRGPTTRPHAPDDAGRAAFLQLVQATAARFDPVVMLVRPGPSQADVLAAARERGIATVALQPDAGVKDPGPLRAADVVVTPTRFAADYLREAFGLPAIDLPPVPPRAAALAGLSAGIVLFDAAGPASGLAVFAQIADEVGRRRSSTPFVVLGGRGEVALPGGGGSVRLVPRDESRAALAAARVVVAPNLGWEQTPLTAVAALARGVPMVASDRGPAVELFGGAGIVLPLPDRLTTAAPANLTRNELEPWAAAVLRLIEDPSAAARQRGLAATDSRFTADALAPRYARFLAGVAAGRAKVRAPQPSANGAPLTNGKLAAVRALADRAPWPADRPSDAAPGREQGWLGAGSEQMLARSLSAKTGLVVELGSWLGLSTRYIADHAPQASVVCVDTWAGSPEHQHDDRYKELLPRLYETFQARCWDYRGRVTPVRADSRAGLREIATVGAKPDFIYVDAEHTYEAVSNELGLIRDLFPDAAVGGDDYNWSGVRTAVDEFAGRHGLVVDRFGARGWRLLDGWRAAEANPVPPGRGQMVVLVPHLNGIEWECEQALRQLEGMGVRVVRRGGCSAIDVARNDLLSDALHDGAERMLFVDADIGFDPADAVRLLARPEPVISAVYPKKGMREMATTFADGTKQVLFGPDAPGPYPLKYAATGFLRVRADVLRRMVADLNLPLCNTHWGRGVWPFFQPTIIPHGPGKFHYLGEDWAFSHRLGQMGVVPLADTSIRLWHWGRYGFGWEDAGRSVERYQTYTYGLNPA